MALRLRSTTISTNKPTTNQENVIGIGRTKQVATVGVGKPSVLGLSSKQPAIVAGRPKRDALGEIGNKASNIPMPSNTNTLLKKDAFVKTSISVTTGPTTKATFPTVRNTKTTAVRQSLMCRTSTLTKPSSAVPASKSILSGSTTAPKLIKSAVLASKPQPSYGVGHRVYAPTIPQGSGIRDFDRDAYNNPVLLGLYSGEIHAYMREIEVKFLVKENFLEGQAVTSKMRAMVVDWLVDVQQQYNLLLETLHLSVGIFDRFLQKHRTITRQKLQLAGVGAMWIAAKYEELFSPELENFVYITDRAYTKAEILKMEQQMHRTLDFSYGQPLSIHFLRRFSNACEALPKHHVFAKYFLELTLLAYNFRHLRPSLIAAIALYVSFCVVGEHGAPGRHIWNDTLKFYTTYTYDDIETHVPSFAALIMQAKSSKLQAVQRKYASAKQMKVSTSIGMKSDILEELANSGAKARTNE